MPDPLVYASGAAETADPEHLVLGARVDGAGKDTGCSKADLVEIMLIGPHEAFRVADATCRGMPFLIPARFVPSRRRSVAAALSFTDSLAAPCRRPPWRCTSAR